MGKTERQARRRPTIARKQKRLFQRNTTLHSFATLAQEYCGLLNLRGRTRTRNLLMRLHQLLPIVHSTALRLPLLYEGAPGCDDRMTFAQSQRLYRSLRRKLGRYDEYAEIFDPYSRSNQEVVVGSLADDLTDIYFALHAGLECYVTRRLSEAAWTWRFEFDIHWGEHATGAMRALYWLHRDDWKKPASLRTRLRKHLKQVSPTTKKARP